jgi:hypothetical protein
MATLPFDNLQATNALADWTNIEKALLLFDGLSDPNTGEPIAIMPDGDHRADGA